MDNDTREIVLSYLKDNRIKIDNGCVRTTNYKLISTLSETFGFNPLFELGVEWVIFKVNDKVYRVKYDKIGRKIAYSGTDSKWEKNYNSDNLITHFKSSSIEWWKEYDQNGNVISYRDKNNISWKKKYDKNNNVIEKIIDG